MSRGRQFLAGYHMGFLALSAVVVMSAPLAAQQGSTTKVGLLRCQTAPAVGNAAGSWHAGVQGLSFGGVEGSGR